MNTATADVLRVLSERGYRITKARVELYHALSRAREPLTIRELVDRTKSDETSAYRFIALLRGELLVEEIAVRGGTSRYALASHHHHHAVCTDCGKVAHIPCNTHERIKVVAEGFKEVFDHEITYYGRCHACAG